MKKFAEVIVDTSNSNVDKIFEYSIPDEMDLKEGSRVKVAFGKQIIQGFVVGLKDTAHYDENKIKPVLEIVDSMPVILPEMIELSKKMKENYHLRMVDVLRLFLPSEMREGKVSPIILKNCRLNEQIDINEYEKKIKSNAKNQLALLDYIKTNKIEKKRVLFEKFSNVTVNKFIKDNVLVEEDYQQKRAPFVENIENKKVKLTELQKNAIEKITASTKPIVLFGVTGSGKTEVYMQVIEKAIKDEKNAIMLVPEISLTPQMNAIFKSRFGKNVAILHSGLSAGERYDEWQRLLLGEAKIALGARSAIFAPLQNLGIIIIDEEHDNSYISESNPRFNTHYVAKLRSIANNCPLVLGSATPDLESFHKTETGEYDLSELPKRVNNKEMPHIQIVDMLSEIRSGNSGIFSNSLKSEMKKAIENKKQIMLFINRRGYSSFMRCGECGYIAKCDSCDVSLVYHKVESKLKCHYCGKRYKALDKCPKCGSESIRQGAVGTERVVNELEKLFPDTKVLRMDNDSVSCKNGHQKILSEFARTKPSILVGTQMIAKGHDFPDVVLVGIIDADQSLYQSNFNSAEKTFELITQVSGRAGRNESEGKIILQTYAPRHYVYKFVANYDYKSFYQKEIEIRKTTHFPPFSTVLRVLVTGKNEEIVKEITKVCYTEISQQKKAREKDFYYLEAMRSPVGRIKDAFRYQILTRFDKNCEQEIKQKIYEICDKAQNNKVSIFVEINPQNLS